LLQLAYPLSPSLPVKGYVLKFKAGLLAPGSSYLSAFPSNQWFKLFKWFKTILLTVAS
jgi:hypothetical protein